jgi:hypothetical protein
MHVRSGRPADEELAAVLVALQVVARRAAAVSTVAAAPAGPGWARTVPAPWPAAPTWWPAAPG